MARLDIPRCTTRAGSKDLDLCNGGSVSDSFGVSAFERARARVSALNERELARQITLIKESLDHGSSLPQTESAGVTSQRIVGSPKTRSHIRMHGRSSAP